MAQPGALDLSFAPGTGADAAVQCLGVQKDGKIVLAGNFLNVNGAIRTNIARLNVDGSLDTGFNAQMSVGGGPLSGGPGFLLEPSGTLLIYGGFTRVNGASITNVARLLPDGTLDAGFNPQARADGTIAYVVPLADGAVLIAGQFTQYDGVPRSKLARLTRDGSLDLSFDPGVGAAGKLWPGAVQPDGKVLVPGTFTNAVGTIRSQMARLNPDGTLDESFDPGTGPSGRVDYVLVQEDGKVIVAGGTLTGFNGVARQWIARLNSDGSVDAAFDAGAGVGITTLYAPVVVEGKVVLAGGFTTFAGVPRKGLVRLLADGSVDPGFDPGANQPGPAAMGVRAQALQSDGRLLIGGTFATIGSTPRSAIARLLTADALDRPPSITTQPTSQAGRAGFDVFLNVVAIGYPPPDYQWLFGGVPVTSATNATLTLSRIKPSQSGDYSVVVSNAFGAITSAVATLNFQTQPGILDPDFAPDQVPNGPAYSLAVQADGKVLLGGNFSRCGSAGCTNIARLNPDGSLDAAFVPAAMSTKSGSSAGAGVLAILPQAGGQIVIGGTLQYTVGTLVLSALARLNADGSLDIGYGPPYVFGGASGNIVHSLAVTPDGRVLAGGLFPGDSTRLVQLTSSGRLDTAHVFGVAATEVQAVAVQPDGAILAVGKSSSSGNLARFLFNADSDASFQTASTDAGIIAAVALQVDGRIVVGGSFTNLNGTARSRVARLNPDGTLDATFDPGAGPNDAVNCLGIQMDGKIVIGGAFTTVSGMPRSRVARLNPDGTVDEAFDSASGPDGPVYALCQQGDGRWWFAGNFTNVQNAPFRSVGRFGPELESPPAIVSQPTALTSQAGRDFWMGVTVSGFPLPTIQWQFNGQDIAGATNAQLVLPSVLPAKAGTYSVVVSNSLGTARSAPITLEVPAPAETTGSVDPLFVPPKAPISAGPAFPPRSPAGVVWSLLVQPDGRVIFGYDEKWQPLNGPPLFRLNPDGSLDSTFRVAPLGADFIYWVKTSAMRADGRIIAAVAAQSYATSIATSEILRLGPDGAIEATLSVIGPSSPIYDAPVTMLSLQADGRILLAGRFTKIGSVPRAGVARLNADGTLDEAFDPGAGLDGKVAVFAANQDGRVLIGGAFTNVWGVLRQGIARLNADGTLDSSFNAQANGSVSQVYLEADGHVVISGAFQTINGVARPALARLKADGGLDDTFDPGATRIGQPSISSASCLGVLSDGRMIAQCALTDTNGVASTKIVQLNADGSIDPGFDTGLGPNRTNMIPQMALQADGQILLAGNFNLFNGFRRDGLVRLFGNKPLSGPQLRNPALAGNTFSVQFLTEAGATYTLEFTDSLSAPAWTPLPGSVMGNGQIMSLTDPAATNPRCFYRVRRQ